MQVQKSAETRSRSLRTQAPRSRRPLPEERREKAKKESKQKEREKEVKVVKRGNTMQAVRVTKPTKPTAAKRVAPTRAANSRSVHKIKGT